MSDRTRITAALEAPDLEDEMDSFLVQLHGSELGSRLPLRLGLTIFGRSDECNFALASDSVSRVHCSILLEKGEAYLQDQGSTNGTWLNGRRLRGQESERLASGDRIQFGDLVYKFLRAGDVETVYHEELRRMAVTDGLTETFNKRYLLDYLEREVGRSLRHGRPLALLLFDIDRFKKLNDEFGHLVGDRVLKQLASRIHGGFLRQEDVLARFGGEEFAVVLPETSAEKAKAAADRLLGLVSSQPFSEGSEAIQVTISIGVGVLERGVENIDALLAAADANLYEAKRRGRNRVVV